VCDVERQERATGCEDSARYQVQRDIEIHASILNFRPQFFDERHASYTESSKSVFGDVGIWFTAAGVTVDIVHLFMGGSCQIL